MVSVIPDCHPICVYFLKCLHDLVKLNSDYRLTRIDRSKVDSKHIELNPLGTLRGGSHEDLPVQPIAPARLRHVGRGNWNGPRSRVRK